MGARSVEHRYHSIIIQQVAGAGFEGPLWSPENLKKRYNNNNREQTENIQRNQLQRPL